MQTKRKTIGRTLGAILTYPVAETDKEQRFVLKSGKTAVFHFVHVPANELETQTFVRFSVNGRDQNALTPESLTDITRTIKLQQFFPAIGYRHNGCIEILDGSRRRAAALLCRVGLNVLVTESSISNDDARQLATDIQTAKEHNLREIGLRLLKLREEGMSQKEIALSEQLSAAKVTRAIQAASVSDNIIALFPVQSELTNSDYKTLLMIDKMIMTKNLPREELLSDMDKKINELTDKGKIAPDELKKAILSELKKLTDNLILKVKPEICRLITLKEFSDKNTYARKRIKERGFSYEFNRLPKELQDKLDNGVRLIIEQYYAGKWSEK